MITKRVNNYILRTPFIWLIMLVLISPVILFSCHKSDETSRPNIIILLADDLGYSDIGCYGGDIETPNIDRLAHNGVTFSHFYNSARCNPSRASIMTGLYPHRTGMGSTQGVRLGVPGYMGEINENCVTIAEVLKPAGYSSFLTGKWHLTYSDDGSDITDWPLQRGFERFFGTIYGAGSYFDPRRLYSDNQIYTSSPDGFYYTDAISDTAVAFIDNHLKHMPGKPFFLYVAYTAPHWPLHAKPEDIARYRGRFDNGWDKMRIDKLERMKTLGLIDAEWDISNQQLNLPRWDESEKKEWEVARMEVYAAMIDCMDQGIGRILAKLEEEGALQNTLIFFLSDNGGCAEIWSPDNPWAKRYGPEVTRDGTLIDYSNDGSRMPGEPDTYFSYGAGWSGYSNTPFRGHKSSSWEGGISTPFIVHWPSKIKHDGICRKQVAGIIDIMPTILEVTGARYPVCINGNGIYPLPGIGLMPVIIENKPVRRGYYYIEHIGNRSIVDSEGWKLVKSVRGDWELYNIISDRTESYNRAGELPLKVEELVSEWEKWANDNFVLPIDSLEILRSTNKD